MKFIIYDLEATCWRGRPPGGYNEIIEIGAVAVNRYGQVLDSFCKFVKPTVNPKLSSFCTKLTSITQAQVDSSKAYPKIIEEFTDWIEIENEFLLCSWGKFDKRIIINNCELHRLESDWVDDNHLDVKEAYHVNRGLSPHRGLKAVVKKEGFEFTGIHHRAISDAENLAKVFVKYIDEWDQ